jgi:uncharacterized protein (UPF0264 family)
LKLLVSVRSAEEVGPALAGGADIIDAKEPDRGSLGAVDGAVLHAVLDRVPADRSVSVALGDLNTEDEVRAALEELALPARQLPTYLKLGFAGTRSREQIQRLIETAVAVARTMVAAPRIVAVGYADSERAGTLRPELIGHLAGAANAAGILLDTYEKDGRGLLEWVPLEPLVEWVARSRRSGLVTALAGSLRAGDLTLVCQADPDVIGVRGAACLGGRLGTVSEERVCRLRLALRMAVRETRESGAISSVQTGAKSRKLKA